MPENPQDVRVAKTEYVKELFANYLDEQNHRRTTERFAILEEIYQRNDHFDVDSLYIYMRDKGFRVSRATIYNTLDLLVACNLVTKHQFGSLQAVYEKSYGFKQHDHLMCTDCGQIFEFCDPSIEEIQTLVGDLLQFDVSHHSLILHGSCKRTNCENKVPDESNVRANH
jgi:Fur family transcriptional regulator, ferric uptake regulator